MLIKNEIPTEEPIISIGIVLPIDNQKTVEIFSTETNENYSISIDNNQISLNNKLNDIIQLENTAEDSCFIINLRFLNVIIHFFINTFKIFKLCCPNRSRKEKIWFTHNLYLYQIV